MKPRLYLYLSKYNSADCQLHDLITGIPARRRNNVVKEILLEGLVARMKRSKSEKPPTSSSQVPFPQDPLPLDVPQTSPPHTESLERPHPPNPLDNLQRALDTIPLKPKGQR